MKKNLLFIFAILLALPVMATTHTVTVADFSFTPANMTIKMGDTVKWVWSSGTHTTTSTSVPSGAATWNSNMNSTTTTFTYVPTVLGTYNYQCSIHPTMMTGSFTVISAAGVPATNNVAVVALSPNPSSSVLHLQFAYTSLPASVSMVDVLGKQVFNAQYNGEKDANLNVGDMPAGTYFISTLQGDKTYVQRVQVVH